jgi:hypothetical protein
MRRSRSPPGLALLGLAFSLACETPLPPLYDWGIYEPLLWEGYRAESGDVDPAAQLARLEADVQRIRASGGRVPPGVYAHLGFLEFSTGDVAAARQHFLEERELFPESAVFIDGVLARMGGGSLPALPEAPVAAPAAAEAEEGQ